MNTKNLMLQAALRRLQYWQDQLLSAEGAKDTSKAQECARFIQEYGVLIRGMVVAQAEGNDGEDS